MSVSVLSSHTYHFYILPHPDRHHADEGVSLISNPPDQPVDFDTAMEKIREWVRERDYVGVLVDTETGRYQVFGTRALPDLNEVPLLTEDDIGFYEALTGRCSSG